MTKIDIDHARRQQIIALHTLAEFLLEEARFMATDPDHPPGNRNFAGRAAEIDESARVLAEAVFAKRREGLHDR